MVRYIIIIHGYFCDTTKYWKVDISELEDRHDVELMAKGLCYDLREEYTNVDYFILDLKEHIKDFNLSNLIQSLDKIDKDNSNNIPKIEIKPIKKIKTQNQSIFKAIFKGLFKNESSQDD